MLLPLGAHQNKQKSNEETKNKSRYAQKKRSVESVLRPEGSLWLERFVKEVGFGPGLKVDVVRYAAT